jgi:hypothetical protein
MRLAAGAESKLRLTLAGKSREAAAKGRGRDLVKVDFGSFDVPAAGYQRFTQGGEHPVAPVWFSGNDRIP